MTAIATRIARLRAASRRAAAPRRDDVVRLSVGEPDLETPRVVTDAMIAALEEGWTHYAPVDGDPDLQRAVVDDARRRYGADYAPRDCLITHGGAAAITSIALALIDHGDVVVTADPTYSLYRDAIALAGGTMIAVEVAPGDEAEGLARVAERAVAENAAMVVICNPVNPSGAVYSARALEALAEGLAGTDVLVLADEAYEAYVYEDGAHASALAIPALRERLVFCQTFSKTYAMTGWRLGYVLAGDPAVLRAVSDVHKTFSGSLNAAVQRAAITAIRTRDETVPLMLAGYASRREYVIDRLTALPGVTFVEPLGAFYVFFEYSYPIRAVELRDRLVREHGVELRPGSEFGDAGEHRLRLSYASSTDVLSEGIDRLELAFTALEAEHGGGS